jgi:collagenase-like PrtC family protease
LDGEHYADYAPAYYANRVYLGGTGLRRRHWSGSQSENWLIGVAGRFVNN